MDHYPKGMQRIGTVNPKLQFNSEWTYNDDEFKAGHEAHMKNAQKVATATANAETEVGNKIGEVVLEGSIFTPFWAAKPIAKAPSKPQTTFYAKSGGTFNYLNYIKK